MLDQKDTIIYNARSAALLSTKEPRVGDVIIFNDKTARRISYIWPDDIQTSSMNSNFYLGADYTSHSGSLYRPFNKDVLKPTNHFLKVRFWFFHHDYWQADNGIDVTCKVHVWKANCTAPN